MALHPYRTVAYGETFASLLEGFRAEGGSTTWLKRAIPGVGFFDFAGPYPCIAPPDYRAIESEIELLKQAGGVSVIFVTNALDEAAVERELPRLSVRRLYKTHHVVDVSQNWRKSISTHHQQELRRARKRDLAVAVMPARKDYAAVFWPLYQVLIRRHAITGIQTLSLEIVAEQCGLPGMLIVDVKRDQNVVASSLWAFNGTQAHIHVHAQTEEAYTLGASYLLYEAAIEHFSDRVERIDLGGGAGLLDNPNDGLARFKRGWSNSTARTYLGGQILDQVRYDSLSAARGDTSLDYFPAYRTPARAG